MPDPKDSTKTLPADQYDALFADDAKTSSVNIDIPNLREEIAAHESKGMGDYEAENDTSTAKGRYQFMWGKNAKSGYGERIKKETGVADSDEFLSSPKAQDDFFDSYTQSDMIPWIAKAKEGNTRGLSDKQLGQLYHFVGPTGAEQYLKTGKYAPPGKNVSIDSYLEERVPQKTLPADQYDALFADEAPGQKKSSAESATGLATSSTPGQNGATANNTPP